MVRANAKYTQQQHSTERTHTKGLQPYLIQRILKMVCANEHAYDGRLVCMCDAVAKTAMPLIHTEQQITSEAAACISARY